MFNMDPSKLPFPDNLVQEFIKFASIMRDDDSLHNISGDTLVEVAQGVLSDLRFELLMLRHRDLVPVEDTAARLGKYRAYIDNNIFAAYEILYTNVIRDSRFVSNTVDNCVTLEELYALPLTKLPVSNKCGNAYRRALTYRGYSNDQITIGAVRSRIDESRKFRNVGSTLECEMRTAIKSAEQHILQGGN